MRRIFLALATAALVAGCASQGEAPRGASGAQATATVLPANYRALIAARVKETFLDPYSIRDAAISTAPSAGFNIYGTTQTVCIRANAKNRMGAYTGATATAYVFNEGKLTTHTSDPAATGMVCGTLAYEPFPEIEVGYKPPSGPVAKR